MVESRPTPTREAKIRILNASHSGIAWAGRWWAISPIHEGTHDPAIRRIAWDYVTNDAIPCLSTPEHPSPSTSPPTATSCWNASGILRSGIPISACHGRLLQDPGFMAPTVRERLADNASIASVAMLPALFLAFLQRWASQ